MRRASGTDRGPSAEGTRALAADLREFAALPSVSSPAPDRAGLDAAVAWLARCLRRHGARRVRVVREGPGPVVLAERPGAPGAPVLLCYAHLDVVGPGPGWSTPPFRPVYRAGRLYGRGTADDKGPLLAQVHAMGRHRGPVGWKFVVDGAEEIGSPGLARLLCHEAGWLDDVGAVLVCDTEAASDGRPTLTRSLRGQLTVRLTVRGAGRELHAGRYGGAVPNPAQALTEVLAALHRPDGTTALPALRRGRPTPPGGTDDLDRRLAAVAVPGWGERAPTAGARVADRPAAIVTALCAGTCAPGPWHVIPATAAATVNVRLVPGQAPSRVLADLRRHVRAHLRPGARAAVRPLVAVPAWSAGNAPGPVSRSARRAVREVWGTDAVDVRSGGTVPAVALLARALPRAEIVPLGVTLPGDGAHGPDEHVDPRRLDVAAATLCRIAELLGGPS